MLIAKPVVSFFLQSPLSPVSHAASKESILFFKDFCEWRNFQKWAREGLATASHAASTLRIMQQSLDKLISMKQDTTINPDYQYLYDSFLMTLSHEADKQRLDGTYLGALALTRADMKHLLNTLMESSDALDGIIRDSYIQAILHHIPLTGVELQFYPQGAIGDEIKHRVIHFVTIWNKGSGVIDAGWSSFADLPRMSFLN
jgi:hypothetical protein